MEIQYFFSPTRSICDHQKVILAEIEKKDKIPVSNYNIFTDLDRALLFGIKSAPALALLIEGKSVEILTGFQSGDHLRDWIKYWREFIS